jgi:hypothetical protein
MHNGLLADPTNPYTIAIKKITNKGSKKMTEADHEQRNRLEWEGGLYWDTEVGPYIASDAIERCVQLGAQKSRLGKDVQASVFCTEPIIKLNYSGPRDKDKLYAMGDEHVLRRGVVINGSRIIRVRPMFREWSVTFTLEYDDTIINEKSLVTAMQDAGSLIGLSDWRPKFGRFSVEIL